MFTVVTVRIAVFTVLPVVAASLHLAADRSVSTPLRRAEVFLLYLFSLSVGIAGVSGFFGHVFLSDEVAASIGWAAGSPFQLEMGFANLALGALGIVAVGRRDGFREATVLAVAVIGVGATIVHLADIAATGNLAPGNTIQNAGNLVDPLLLVVFLLASRRAEREAPDEAASAAFAAWRGPHIAAAWWLGASAATGFSVGYALESTLLGTLVGTAIGAAMAVLTLRRASGSAAG